MRKIQILGTGCPKCRQLSANVDQALQELGSDAVVEKVSEISEIMKFHVMMTPALVIDGEVKSVGKVVTPQEVRQMLQ